jgi:serine/threonine protein kinase
MNTMYCKIEDINSGEGVEMKYRDMFALTDEDVKIDYRDKLGEGNFCSVYPVHIRNKENQFNEELPPFALKQLNYDIITHPNPNIIKAACDDLANEARIMKELQHDHILPILGMSQQRDIGKDTLFIIVEKLESTLDSKLNEWAKDLGIFRQIISKEDVITRINNVALTIGQGLQYMHSQNCLFRDLKPANIGFDQSGSVKIFDWFGRSRSNLFR